MKRPAKRPRPRRARTLRPAPEKKAPAARPRSPSVRGPGWAVRQVTGGGPGELTYTVVELDYWADPDRDEAWAARQMAAMPSLHAWRREFLRDWTTSAGSPFYPEVATDADRYIRRLPRLISGPVYRGWDFGYRRPACVWLQWSPASRRLWAIREVLPENLDTYAHRDLVLYCSGQRALDDLKNRPRALEWVRVLEDGPCPPPWFPPGTRFVDYAGPEALQRTASVEHEHADRTDAAILRAEGIDLQVFTTSINAREQVMRSLLTIRPDGAPGLLLDPACRRLIEGMKGGIGYPEATKANPTPTQPRKDGFYEHLHDALGYAAINLCPIDERPQRRATDELVGGFDLTI